MNTCRSVHLKRASLLVGTFFLGSLLALAVALAAPAPDHAAGHGPAGQTAAEKSAGQISGSAHVIDGDTVDVAGERLRLEGIDAPELAQTCSTADGASWPCGTASADHLRRLAEHKDLYCDRRGADKYGRTLAVCFEDGENLNELMVRSGFAWAFVKYSHEFVAAEQAARAASAGIWQGPAQPAWEFRRAEWQTAETAAPGACAIKGNISGHGRIYHLPWSPWYDKVKIEPARGERWFCSEQEALSAGWRPASPN